MLRLTVPRAPVPLSLTAIVATVWALVAAVVTIGTVITDLLAQTIPVSLDVAQFWPKVNPTMKLDGITASVVGGGYDRASFTIAGLGLDARLWYAGAALSEGLAVVAVSVTIALLCNRVWRGDPFDLTVPRAFTLSGFAVLFGGLAWQICNQVAGYRVIDETFMPSGASWTTTVHGMTMNSVTWPHGATSFNVISWPVGIAMGLFAIAVVFRYGAKIARERAALAEEVKGLV